MLVIACVAIIVVGPKDLPAMLRTLGKTIGNVKRMAGDFQRQFNDAIKEAELDEVKDLGSSTFAPLEDAKKSMEEFAATMTDPVESETIEKPKAEEAPAPAPAKKPAAKTANKTTAKKAATRKTAAPRKAASKTAAAKNGAANTTTAKAEKKPAPRRAAPKKAAAAKAKATTSESAV